MPELPEVHIASKFINQVASGRFFRGPIIKSDVSKMKAVEWNKKLFTISASSRGKEMQMVLSEVPDEVPPDKILSRSQQDGPGIASNLTGNASTSTSQFASADKLTLTFGFGMSGKFSFDRFDQIPKHAHLQFFTGESPANVLSFVDFRRFGTWEERDYDFSRGPDPTYDYANFRRNVLSNLDKSVFGKAICETIMDQKYFNGIGNYLRAEILYRAKIPPFSQARSVLEPFSVEHEVDPVNPDLLDLCYLVPREVFEISKPGEGYQPNSELDIYAPFKKWLQCYMKPGMRNLIDRQNRTMWFHGPAGAMVPVQKGSRHARQKKVEEKEESADEEGPSNHEKLKMKKKREKPENEKLPKVENSVTEELPAKPKRLRRKLVSESEIQLNGDSNSVTSTMAAKRSRKGKIADQQNSANLELEKKPNISVNQESSVSSIRRKTARKNETPETGLKRSSADQKTEVDLKMVKNKPSVRVGKVTKKALVVKTVQPALEGTGIKKELPDQTALQAPGPSVESGFRRSTRIRKVDIKKN